MGLIIVHQTPGMLRYRILYWRLLHWLSLYARVGLWHMPRRSRVGQRLTMPHLTVLLRLQIYLMVCLGVLVVMGHSLVNVTAVTLVWGRARIGGRLRVDVRCVPLRNLIGRLVGLLHHRMLSGRKLLFLFLLVRITSHRLLSVLSHLRISKNYFFVCTGRPKFDQYRLLG